MKRKPTTPERALDLLQQAPAGLSREELAEALGISVGYTSTVIARVRDLLPPWSTVEAIPESWHGLRLSRYHVVRDWGVPGPGQGDLFEEEVAA